MFFPTDAVISLVVSLSTGEMVESAMVRRDGVIGAGRWSEDVRLSDLEPKFTCQVCGNSGADIRPLFERRGMDWLGVF
ncbi:hypothetical protein ACFIOY_40155 [Bradyrhizobium sp. TZ2]